ncbi:MAG: DegT/DnrJ/EryC1/StrS family aminotransferase [Lachnospiraceae bacterium]|nr:DegT/DnrJ/EryC1/StrS family aminotransferase [Lachnospiraceae bacterium]
MEFRDLKAQYQHHKEEIDDAIRRVLSNGGFIGGAPVRELEEKLAEYVGVKHCITCANGTDALQLALMAWGIGPGDAVFVPDFTFFSSAEVVPVVGATPVFVDIDADTYNMSPDSLEKAIQYVHNSTDLRPRAIVAVDLFGQPADYDRIRKIAQQYHLFLLEDAAQGFGGSIRGKRACAFGDISTTSFFPAKPLGCYGDGGAIFTDHDEWAALLRSYCVHGKGADKYDNVRIGMNSRLDTIQAAVLLKKLAFFDEETEKCNRVAAEYSRLLQGHVKTPVAAPEMYSGWAQYTIRLEDEQHREDAMQRLKDAGIPTAVYYKKPLHKQEALKDYAVSELDYHVTEQTCLSCLSLPMHAYLETGEIEKICETIKSVTP